VVQTKITKGFTLLELLVVISLLGIFSAIAYPNITGWVIDREVRKEVYGLLSYIEEAKSEVINNKYPIVQFRWVSSANSWATADIYYMEHATFFNQCKKSGSANTCKTSKSCGSPSSQNGWLSKTTYTNTNIRHSPNTALCITKDGSISADINDETEASTGRKVERLVICSSRNTTDQKGATPCTLSNNGEYRYKLTWDRFVNIKIYKYNKSNDTWVLQDG
jgi:prepilin-type N-terminal cleavage/methylation domain-containing protein